jgi:uncharacterized protein
MNQFIEWISQPWPWYVAGPMIGLTVPALLILGNKTFGISSSLRHVCAACVPAGIPFFTYDWKKEIWNLLFVLGTAIGGFIAMNFLANPETIVISEATQADLTALGITNFTDLMPVEIFNWNTVFTGKGVLFFVIGGFLVGLYLWSCHHGDQFLAMAISGSDHFLYGRWILDDPCLA